MTNVQKAYNAVYRENEGAANFNMIFPTLGTIGWVKSNVKSPWSKKLNEVRLKGIHWFQGMRKHRKYNKNKEAQDAFRIYLYEIPPKKRKERMYELIFRGGYDGSPSLWEIEFFEQWVD